MDKEDISSKSTDNRIAETNNWFKIVIISIITGVMLYKIVITPINLSSFEFSDLLSLVLALFAIVLSVLFYLKATDTSNNFYDNTYHFTQDMSIMLGRIEAGFGERLRHLDEGYSGLVNKFERFPNDKSGTEEKIEKNEKEIEKVAKEKEEIIQDLLQKTQLQAQEKEMYSRQLAEKDKELDNTKEELALLRSKLTPANVPNVRFKSPFNTPSGHYFVKDFYNHIYTKLDVEEVNKSPTSLRQQFKRIKNQISPAWLEVAERIGWVDKNGLLTLEGIKGIMEMIDSQDL
jgi:hypothetical protein